MASQVWSSNRGVPSAALVLAELVQGLRELVLVELVFVELVIVELVVEELVVVELVVVVLEVVELVVEVVEELVVVLVPTESLDGSPRDNRLPEELGRKSLEVPKLVFWNCDLNPGGDDRKPNTNPYHVRA